ncbi:MAG: type II toxin-antitoxin system RelE/ParE family toxin [Candidatus Bipolaricaulia bacterium]
MRYRIEAVSSRIKRELRRIHPADRQRISEAVEALADDPRPPGVKQLEPDVYRLRVGDYRVVYKVFDAEGVILIGRVVRRSESTYRDLRRLFG